MCYGNCALIGFWKDCLLTGGDDSCLSTDDAEDLLAYNIRPGLDSAPLLPSATRTSSTCLLVSFTYLSRSTSMINDAKVPYRLDPDEARHIHWAEILQRIHRCLLLRIQLLRLTGSASHIRIAFVTAKLDFSVDTALTEQEGILKR